MSMGVLLFAQRGANSVRTLRDASAEYRDTTFKPNFPRRARERILYGFLGVYGINWDANRRNMATVIDMAVLKGARSPVNDDINISKVSVKS